MQHQIWRLHRQHELEIHLLCRESLPYYWLLCSNFTSWIREDRNWKSAFSIFGFVRLSARLTHEQTSSILKISWGWQACLSDCISSIMRFSLVWETLLIMSNSDFEYVIRCIRASEPNISSSCDLNANALSKRSANAITSAERTDLVICLDL